MLPKKGIYSHVGNWLSLSVIPTGVMPAGIILQGSLGVNAYLGVVPYWNFNIVWVL